MIKILNREKFEEIKSAGKGYVVVTDKPNKTRRLHETNCAHVEISNFIKKVIENKEENGSYYWFIDKKDAVAEMDVEKCLVCMR